MKGSKVIRFIGSKTINLTSERSARKPKTREETRLDGMQPSTELGALFGVHIGSPEEIAENKRKQARENWRLAMSQNKLTKEEPTK